MREGQRVKAGDELFEIDREPFRIAVDQAQAKLATVRTDFTNLKSDYQIYSQLAEVAQQNAELKKNDVERKKALAESRAGSQVDLDTSHLGATHGADCRRRLAAQRKDQALNQLLGDPNLPIEKFPAYMQAAAALEQAQRDLDHTAAARADRRHGDAGRQHPARPLRHRRHAGVRRDRRQRALGRRQSEGNRHHLSADRPARDGVRRHVPRHAFFGTVESVSPGTGAQFAILPPQNASGNWVKVVQRVPLRVRLDKDPMTSKLRAGMSAYVEIDTGKRKRWLGSIRRDVKQAADQK